MTIRAEPKSPNEDRFTSRCVIAGVVFISLLALGMLLWYSIPVLLLIFAGILIAIMLRGLADWLHDVTGLGHKPATIIVLLVIIGFIGGVVWIAAPSLTREMAQLSEQLPKSVEVLKQNVDGNPIGKIILRYMPPMDSLMTGRVTGLISGTMGAIISFMVVLFTGLYLALSPRMYVKGFIHLIPNARRDRMAEVLGATGYTLKWWIIGQSIDMVIIGIATWIGLWLIGVPLAMLLGLIAALFNFIPNFGPLFSMVPAVLLALGEDPQKAAYVVALFLVLQNVEGYILMPWIQSKAVDLPDAITIVAQVLLGILAGGIGLALAAPLAAATMVAVKMLYVEDTLGDNIKTPADGDAREEVREVKQAAREVEAKRQE